jgi:four helix bundle protein
MGRFDLENRLINFSVSVMDIVNKVPRTINGTNLAKQLSRSGTSVSLHYGEAQSAESRRDFIHKMKVVLKELRETNICLRLIEKTGLVNERNDLESIKREGVELISIFVKSIETARKNAE